MNRLLKSLLFLLFLTFSANVLIAQSIIRGNLWYNMDQARPLVKVKVTLLQIDGQNNKSWTSHTDENGIYQFSSLGPGTYQLTFSSNLQPDQATQKGADLLKNYLNGQTKLTAMQLLAADVDGSGDVMWADYNLLISNIYQGVPFPSGAWKFQSITITLSTSAGTRSADGDPKDLGGICSGDIGGTFVPGTKSLDVNPLYQISKEHLRVENYPNPFTSSTTLSINNPQAGSAVLQLFDVSGRLVKTISLGYLQQGTQEIKINTEKLNKGKYICRLQVYDAKTTTYKLFTMMKAD